MLQIFISHGSVMFLVRSTISLMRMKEARAEAVKCDKSAVIWRGGTQPLALCLTAQFLRFRHQLSVSSKNQRWALGSHFLMRSLWQFSSGQASIPPASPVPGEANYVGSCEEAKYLFCNSCPDTVFLLKNRPTWFCYCILLWISEVEDYVQRGLSWVSFQFLKLYLTMLC